MARLNGYLCLAVLLCSPLVWAGGTPDGVNDQPSRVPTVGDPVSVGSGEEQLSFKLYDIAGPIPMDLNLYYQSQAAQSSDFIGGFYLEIPQLWHDGTSFKITALHGMDAIEFYETPGGWQANAKAAWPYMAQLVGTNYYVLSPADNSVYYFEPVNVGLSICRKKTDRAGNSLYYNYENYGGRVLPNIRSISNDYGQCIDIYMGQLAGSYWAVTSMCRRAEGAQPWVFRYVNNSFSGDQYVLSDIQNPGGGVTHFNYWTNGQCITSVEYPNGTVPYTTTYEARRVYSTVTKKVVISQSNALGGLTTLDYDFDAGQTIEVRPDGLTNIYVTAVYTTEYSRASGAATHLAFAGGMELNFAQDNDGNITNTVTGGGASMRKEYDPQSGKLAYYAIGTNAPLVMSFTSVTQRFYGLNGTSADFTFRDEVGQQFPDESAQTMQYDGSGNLTGLVNAVTSRWSYAYNAQGLLTHEINPLGGVTESEYDEKGQLVRAIDEIAGTNTYAYDSLGRLVRQTDALGYATSMGYDSLGRMTAITNAIGVVTRYVYDGNGNRTQTLYPDGSTVDVQYNAMNQVLAVTNALGQRAATEYDTMGRISHEVGIDGITNAYFYDAAGHVTNVVRADYQWVGTYDADGLLIAEQASGRLARTYQHDAAGHVTRVQDALHRIWQIDYDALGNRTRTVDPAGRVTTYAHNAAGELTEVTRPGNITARYTRDALGNVATITEPGGGLWQFQYHPAGVLTNIVNPLGHSTGFGYNELGVLKQAAFPDGDVVNYQYDGESRLTNAVSGSDSVALTYDSMDRPTRFTGGMHYYDLAGRPTQQISGVTTSTLQWNQHDQLTAVTLTPPGITFTYQYDALTGFITNISYSWGVGSASFNYDTAGRLTTLSRGNGIQATRTWSDTGNGKQTAITDGSFINVQYGFNLIGNITSCVGVLPVNIASNLMSATEQFGVNAMNQITNSGYVYSLRGELLSAPGVTCRWDNLSRLQAINGVTNQYDAANRLLLSDHPAQGASIHYSYCDQVNPQIPVRLDNPSEGSYIQAVLPGWGLIYTIATAPAGTNIIYYHYDQRGSTVATTDGSGQLTGRFAYTPYGQLINPDNADVPPFQYLGRFGCHWVEGTDDLYRHGARCYHPETGTFISPEPDWPDLQHPERLNIYNYAASDPVNAVDFDGYAYQEEFEAYAGLFDAETDVVAEDEPFQMQVPHPGYNPDLPISWYGNMPSMTVYMIEGVPCVPASGQVTIFDAVLMFHGGVTPVDVGKEFFAKYEDWRRLKRNARDFQNALIKSTLYRSEESVETDVEDGNDIADFNPDHMADVRDRSSYTTLAQIREGVARGFGKILRKEARKKQVVDVTRPALKKAQSTSGR